MESAARVSPSQAMTVTAAPQSPHSPGASRTSAPRRLSRSRPARRQYANARASASRRMLRLFWRLWDRKEVAQGLPVQLRNAQRYLRGFDAEQHLLGAVGVGLYRELLNGAVRFYHRNLILGG